MNALLIALVGAVSAGLTTLVNWLLGRRKASGRVATTEAETLWAEGAAMRAELRDETVALRLEAATLRDEAAALRAEMATLRAEAVLLRAEAAAARDQMLAMRERLTALEAG